jgi:GNAT superfamily N-acetyltransferase
VLLTRELDETLRRAELAGTHCGVETVQRLHPEVGAASIEVAGGFARFTGRDSPLSHAFGVGVCAQVTADDIARVTDFYESRGAVPRVFVTPLSDPTLGAELSTAGYTASEYENVLASRDFDAHAQHDERIAIAADLAAWARASARGFTDADVLEPGEDAIAVILASSDGVVSLEAREGDDIVATSAMDIRHGCAALFAGSTMARHRGQGWHLAMIRDRIARARDAGATLLRATARPASASERNFHRCGFHTLYTRVLWERKRQY